MALAVDNGLCASPDEKGKKLTAMLARLIASGEELPSLSQREGLLIKYFDSVCFSSAGIEGWTERRIACAANRGTNEIANALGLPKKEVLEALFQIRYLHIEQSIQRWIKNGPTCKPDPIVFLVSRKKQDVHAFSECCRSLGIPNLTAGKIELIPNEIRDLGLAIKVNREGETVGNFLIHIHGVGKLETGACDPAFIDRTARMNAGNELLKLLWAQSPVNLEVALSVRNVEMLSTPTGNYRRFLAFKNNSQSEIRPRCYLPSTGSETEVLPRVQASDLQNGRRIVRFYPPHCNDAPLVTIEIINSEGTFKSVSTHAPSNTTHRESRTAFTEFLAFSRGDRLPGFLHSYKIIQKKGVTRSTKPRLGIQIRDFNISIPQRYPFETCDAHTYVSHAGERLLGLWAPGSTPSNSEPVRLFRYEHPPSFKVVSIDEHWKPEKISDCTLNKLADRLVDPTTQTEAISDFRQLVEQHPLLLWDAVFGHVGFENRAPQHRLFLDENLSRLLEKLDLALEVGKCRCPAYRLALEAAVKNDDKTCAFLKPLYPKIFSLENPSQALERISRLQGALS